MIAKIKKILEEIVIGEEVVLETEKPHLAMNYVHQFKKDYGKVIAVRIVQDKFIKIICVNTFNDLQQDVEIILGKKIPTAPYALAKLIIQKLVFKKTYVKVFVHDIEELKRYLNLLKDKNTFYTVMYGITYRKNEVRVKRVK